MAQCELCGDEVPSLTTARVEGAELDVCESCADLGTEVTTETSTTSTKYSTSSSSKSSSSGSGAGGGGGTGGGGGGGGSSRRRRDMFDEMEELAPDYGDRIRTAREERELSQEDLARELSEKASLIRKLERGDVLPSDEVQRELERELDISLTGESADEDTDWSGEGGSEGLTLGDMVKRKD
ncbi:MAG: multiprotein bridging factor aMBF1 [Halobacteriaceae archaeon]